MERVKGYAHRPNGAPHGQWVNGFRVGGYNENDAL